MHARLLAGPPHSAMQALLPVLQALAAPAALGEGRPLGPLIAVLGAVRQVRVGASLSGCQQPGDASALRGWQPATQLTQPHTTPPHLHCAHTPRHTRLPPTMRFARPSASAGVWPRCRACWRQRQRQAAPRSSCARALAACASWPTATRSRQSLQRLACWARC
jgi:hypothetical protein